jgi:pimeloyl-ACP methyl ester carboxylesterase
VTVDTKENAESISNSSRRKFLEYAALGAAGVAVVASGANILSPLRAVAATAGGQASSVKLSPTGHTNGINVVLVHGIWADATSYRFVIPLLLDAGYTVWAPQLPETTHLADDVTAALGVIQQAVGPTVLVGHSYGGAVITNAGAELSNVIGLVFCDAFAPDVGEELGQFPPAPGLANLYPVVYPNSFGTFFFINQQKFRESFCADVDPSTAALMSIVQKPANSNLLTDKTTAAAWKTIPSWYLIGGKDQMLLVSQQQFFATRMKATTVTVPSSSHVSIVSHPDVVFELIQKAAGKH